MNEYVAQDKAQQARDDEACAIDMLEDERSELSCWLSESLTMAEFQKFLESRLNSKVGNETTIKMLFMDNCKFQDLVANFADDVSRMIADEVIK
jgi:hypothetical protein